MIIDTGFRCGYRHRMRAFFLGSLVLPLTAGTALAQNNKDSDDEVIEEIVSVGSQIKGAKISGALAVSVVDAADIEAIGVDSGDELLDFMAEQGQNYFSESENISGGVNSARGDIGAYNLRNLGTGNTLVLINGRRVVNAAAYQTEQVGGSFVPVNTANAQTLPVVGLERVEILRDGASAIYGADAVAGVVNYVLKNDFEGFSVSAKYAEYEVIPRTDQRLTLQWGKNFNGGRTNLSVFANYYHRDPVNSQDDARWASGDLTSRVPEDSPWFGDSAFFNLSANSEYGQFDVVDGVSSFGLTGQIWDSSGEFQVYPVGNQDCDWSLSSATCGAVDGDPIYRYNLNENRDLYSDLDRINVYAMLNHDFGNGVESFTEVSAYSSTTTTLRQASTRLSAVAKYTVGAENYYNPFGPCGSPNRLPFDVIGDDSNGGVPCTGLELQIDNYRWVIPRVVDVDGDVFRIVQGFRGSAGSWDWETAATWSRATRDDVTHNRISNTAIQAALNDPTSAAFNPFVGRDNNNIEQALIDVYRKNTTELQMVDFKMSKNDLFEMPAGPVGMVAGVEYREESFKDDRDPRLDGQITFVDNDGNGFPIVSDVMNSSPTLDSKGDRSVVSAFTEFQVPLFSTLDAQFAARYEDFSDIGNTTVGKVALGWRPVEPLLIRGSWSEAFRVPNLVTVNESGVARSNTVEDYLCSYVDPNETLLDCTYGMQRTAGGSDDLVPEQSTNTSMGMVLDVGQHFTVTLDFWKIKKDDTIGLFGEANHTALDLLLRLEAGNANCGSVAGNPSITREDASALAPEEAALYTAAGLCPAGQVSQVNDVYKNLDTREVKGHDLGIYADFDTGIGSFDFTYVGSFLDKYDQVATGPALQLIEAQEAGVLPLSVPVEGFADLIRQDANPAEKHTVRLSWRRNDWGAALTGNRIGSVIQTSLTLDDGSKWVMGPMTTYNASVDYRFNAFADTRARLRLGAVNLTNERAPLADRNFGYWADVYRDMPRSYYLDVRLDF